jgi:DNA-binding LytR/AlgR family response regulator
MKAIYETHDSLKHMIESLPNSFLRVHSSYIVNFDHAYKVVETKNKSYFISFKNYDEVAHMSRQKASDILSDPKTHSRLYFIDQKRKE